MKPKVRGNGQGTAYKRGRTWEVQVIVGYKDSNVPGGQRVPIKRRKGGFPSKAAALAACAGALSERSCTHDPTGSL